METICADCGRNVLALRFVWQVIKGADSGGLLGETIHLVSIFLYGMPGHLSLPVHVRVAGGQSVDEGFPISRTVFEDLAIVAMIALAGITIVAWIIDAGFPAGFLRLADVSDLLIAPTSSFLRSAVLRTRTWNATFTCHSSGCCLS